ncbi:MAG: SGNH/GDSL hydrolase family protein [Terracidiphilus sp.]
MKLSQSLFISLLVLTATLALPAQQLALKDGDRVAFYGDSITAQRYYTRYVEDFLLTRYPNLHVTFFNAGIPGDNVNGGYTGDAELRLKRDLFPHQPTVVTIMLGMNDGFYSPFEPKYLDIYSTGYHKLLDSIQSNLSGVRITVISPTPYDETTHGTEFPHYNETMTRYTAWVRDLAATSHYVYADFNTPMNRLTEKAAALNPSFAELLIPDRIHPSEPAQWIMAAALARGWGFSPVVADVHLDASQPSAIAAQNAEVSALALKDGTLTWTELDGSLPLPLDLENGLARFVLSVSDLAEMDQEILRVDHLTAPRYTLKIDGHTVSTFDRGQLEQGVNLALYSTPMEDQARDIDGTENERTVIDNAHFVVAIEDPKVPDEAGMNKALEEKDALLSADQHKNAQPKPHAFELDPQ